MSGTFFRLLNSAHSCNVNSINYLSIYLTILKLAWRGEGGGFQPRALLTGFCDSRLELTVHMIFARMVAFLSWYF